MNFEDLKYDDTLEFNPQQEAASFEQRQFLARLWDSNMQNAIPEKERIQIDVWLNNMSELTYADASMLIDRILEAQPQEPMSMTQTGLAKWIKKYKLNKDVGG